MAMTEVERYVIGARGLYYIGEIKVRDSIHRVMSDKRTPEEHFKHHTPWYKKLVAWIFGGLTVENFFRARYDPDFSSYFMKRCWRHGLFVCRVSKTTAGNRPTLLDYAKLPKLPICSKCEAENKSKKPDLRPSRPIAN